jgi:hypothetical protein
MAKMDWPGFSTAKHVQKNLVVVSTLSIAAEIQSDLAVNSTHFKAKHIQKEV